MQSTNPKFPTTDEVSNISQLQVSNNSTGSTNKIMSEQSVDECEKRFLISNARDNGREIDNRGKQERQISH